MTKRAFRRGGNREIREIVLEIPGGHNSDHESFVLRMDHDVSKRPVVQSEAGPVDGPGDIIDTGSESYRFRRTLERKKGGKG